MVYDVQTYGLQNPNTAFMHVKYHVYGTKCLFFIHFLNYSSYFTTFYKRFKYLCGMNRQLTFRCGIAMFVRDNYYF